MCCPQPVQVTFPQDGHEAGEHILISYISSSLPRDKCIPWGVYRANTDLRDSVEFCPQEFPEIWVTNVHKGSLDSPS
jgi:hypothetical protein